MLLSALVDSEKNSGTARTVGKASLKGSVTVSGRVKPFRIYLENIPNPFFIHPYVVKDLAHCVNLGQAFLRRNNINLRFKESGIRLAIKDTLLTSLPARRVYPGKV